MHHCPWGFDYRENVAINLWKILWVFSPLAVVFSDVFFLCVPGPSVCCFKSSTRQRERVLWKPCIPCGRIQPKNSPEHGGDVLVPPARACWKASTAGDSVSWLCDSFPVVLGDSRCWQGSICHLTHDKRPQPSQPFVLLRAGTEEGGGCFLPVSRASLCPDLGAAGVTT